MVNVTKSNFLSSLHDLLLHLPTASYIAIDEEMTGIRINKSKPNKAELPSERYVSSWKGVPERYRILQVGVALFCRNPEYDTANNNNLRGDNGSEEQEGPGLSLQDSQEEEDDEHPFIHREGTLNQDELEDLTEREEDAALHPTKKEVPEYTSRIYNFYLFDSHRDLTLASDTVQFLLENKMDFNKVFGEGISFTTVQQAEAMKKKFIENKMREKDESSEDGGKLNSTPKKSEKNKIKLTRTEDLAFVARTMASLREWIDADNGEEGNNTEGGENDPDTGVGARQTEGSSLVLPPCNAFLRRCLYETIEDEYPGLTLERADSGPNPGAARNQIRVIRMNSAEKKQRKERLLQEQWSKILYTIGFTTIFQAISDACNGRKFSEKQIDAFFAGESSEISIAEKGRKIPLVIHNGLMDLMFLLTHCHDANLPDSFEDTKKLIREYFPLIYDTKIMSTECSDSVVRGGSTALSELYQSVFSSEMNDLGLRKSTITNGESNEQAHEAAWDAYMTGCVFYALSRKILDPIKESRLDLDRILEHEPVGSLHRGSLGLNKVYMHLSLYTIDLESKSGVAGLYDPLSYGLSASTTFYVSGIDTTVSTRDILKALIDGGTTTTPELLQRLKYEIIWIDDSSFFVGTKLENIGSTEDDLIALHVHGQLHAGLRGIRVQNVGDYFTQKNMGKDSIFGSLHFAMMRLFGGKKRLQEGGGGEPMNKRRRII